MFRIMVQEKLQHESAFLLQKGYSVSPGCLEVLSNDKVEFSVLVEVQHV